MPMLLPEPIASRQPRTAAQAAFFNAGVEAMRAVANRAAEAVQSDAKKPVIHREHAAAALHELAVSGYALLIFEPTPPVTEANDHG